MFENLGFLTHLGIGRDQMMSFIQNIEVEDLQTLEKDMVKSYEGMMKAGAAKTADILIPQD